MRPTVVLGYWAYFPQKNGQPVQRKLSVGLQMQHVMALQRGLIRLRLGHKALARALLAHNKRIGTFAPRKSTLDDWSVVY